ncbi:hypothetical protein DD238_008202 [Peronospora effusa]|uniref:Peptidase S33 tripeptidyl aminopeptidase-like C-terminal domain-containing protein n=1 Tax=Peronospora effusa TaxID=542832 RepID=A0A3M6V8Q8_9STRA|nr:hypothetical protein DD238_008202 [Peronospora effusa]
MNLRYTNARMTNTCDGGRFDVPLYCAFSKEESAVCDKLDVGNYVGNGIVYAVDNAKIPPQASVLLLNSKLDAQAPQKFAKHLLKVLDGDKKELITFEDSVHIAMISTHLGQGSKTCGMKLLVSYVTNDGDLERLEKSCVDEMPAKRFIPNSLQTTLQNLITQFDENPKSTCAAFVGKLISDQSSKPASYNLRQTLRNLLLNAGWRTLFPPLVYRLKSLRGQGCRRVEICKLIVETNAQVNNDDSSYVLLYYLISLSEMWERPPPSIK